MEVMRLYALMNMMKSFMISYEKLIDFIDTLKNDVVIKGIDIAKYIIPKYQVSDHLALEKLVYFCYAEYLCKSRKRLFSDQVMAFDMGPVVDSVYAEYRGQSEIRSEISLDAARSRLMSLPDGIEILKELVEKAIQEANLGFNPMVEGNNIRINII